ncbi:MAG: hypothetical protein QM757_07300 [Paludibaculum sp.]
MWGTDNLCAPVAARKLAEILGGKGKVAVVCACRELCQMGPVKPRIVAEQLGCRDHAGTQQPVSSSVAVGTLGPRSLPPSPVQRAPFWR